MAGKGEWGGRGSSEWEQGEQGGYYEIMSLLVNRLIRTGRDSKYFCRLILQEDRRVEINTDGGGGGLALQCCGVGRLLSGSRQILFVIHNLLVTGNFKKCLFCKKNIYLFNILDLFLVL